LTAGVTSAEVHDVVVAADRFEVLRVTVAVRVAADAQVFDAVDVFH